MVFRVDIFHFGDRRHILLSIEFSIGYNTDRIQYPTSNHESLRKERFIPSIQDIDMESRLSQSDYLIFFPRALSRGRNVKAQDKSEISQVELAIAKDHYKWGLTTAVHQQ